MRVDRVQFDYTIDSGGFVQYKSTKLKDRVIKKIQVFSNFMPLPVTNGIVTWFSGQITLGYVTLFTNNGLVNLATDVPITASVKNWYNTATSSYETRLVPSVIDDALPTSGLPVYAAQSGKIKVVYKDNGIIDTVLDQILAFQPTTNYKLSVLVDLHSEI